MLKYIIALVLLGSVSQIMGQDCFEFYKTNCKPPKSIYHYTTNKSSVSFKFKSGQIRVIPFTLLAGKDYRITICASDDFSDVIELLIKKDDNTILYDNSKNNYKLNIEFSVKNTRDVEFQLKAPELFGNETPIEGCIGLLIEDMVSLKTGF